MLSIQGLICKDLKRQDKLPEKWEDLIMEETIPRNPITDSCFLYLDAINNTGNGHDANYKSGDAIAWKNLCGSGQVFKSGTKYLPVIHDDSVFLKYFGWNSTTGFSYSYFNKLPSLDRNYENTIETVLTIPANSSGFGVYGDTTNQSIYFLKNRVFCFMIFHRKSGSSYSYNETQLSLASIPAGTRVYIVTRFNKGKLIIDVPSYNIHFEKDAIGHACDVDVNGANIGRGAAMSDHINEAFYSSSHISSLRVHTRVLTNDEIYANYKYEKFRYNIPEIES